MLLSFILHISLLCYLSDISIHDWSFSLGKGWSYVFYSGHYLGGHYFYRVSVTYFNFEYFPPKIFPRFSFISSPFIELHLIIAMYLLVPCAVNLHIVLLSDMLIPLVSSLPLWPTDFVQGLPVENSLLIFSLKVYISWEFTLAVTGDLQWKLGVSKTIQYKTLLCILAAFHKSA